MTRTRKELVGSAGAPFADYDGLLAAVVRVIEDSRRTAARSVNTVMTTTYWLVGRRIVEQEQGGETRPKVINHEVDAHLEACAIQVGTAYPPRGVPLGYLPVGVVVCGRSATARTRAVDP
jgi:hypothetical protein